MRIPSDEELELYGGIYIMLVLMALILMIAEAAA